MSLVTCSTDRQAIEGEVLPPLTAMPGAHLIYHPSPMTKARRITVPEGATIADMVAIMGIGPRLYPHLECYIGDDLVPHALWKKVKPKANSVVYVRVRPAGGRDSKDVLRSVLMIAVMVWAYAAGAVAGAIVGGGLFGAVAQFAVSAIVGTVGMQLVNALIPPPRLTSRYGFDQQLGNPYAQITGIRNQFAPDAPIPRVIGKRRLYPMLAARPYTESQGNTQYLRMLFLVGYGRLRISDIRIGDTPISAFAGAQVEILEGTATDNAITLYTKTVSEQSLSILLTHLATSVRSTAAGTREISVDVSFPSGLATYDNNGNRTTRTVEVSVDYSADGVTWSQAVWIDGNAAYGTGTNGRLVCTDASASTVVRSGRFAVPSTGTWQVRLSRLTAAGTSQQVDLTYWTVLRSIKPEQSPTNMPGVALIAMRLEATAQLNGVPDIINCIAESYIPVWNGTTWTETITRNPAWGCLDVFRRRGVTSVIADDRLNLADFSVWAAACEATAPNAAEPRWTFDAVLEGGSIIGAASQIAAHGRARITVVDGKYTVVRDIQQTTPVQHITPRNSANYRGRKAFADIPHALRVRFTNPDRNYAQDEVTVYRDGYTADNASKFDTIEMLGLASATLAWREGRYHLAQLLLRPEEHTVDMDVEAMRCTPGDLVRFSHDVIKIGLATGRLVGVTTSGGSITHFVLDQPVTMNAGTTYAVRVRKADGATVLCPVTTISGDQTALGLTTPITASGGPVAGDLWIYGESEIESAPMIVKTIAPGEDFAATVTMVDAQPGVYTADTGTIPAFQTYISSGVPIDQQRPSAPTITLRSDETAIVRLADGTLLDQIAVTIQPLPAGSIGTRWQVEYRPANTNGDWISAAGAYGVPLAQGTVFISPVVAGSAYDVRARVTSESDIESVWSTTYGHTVVGKTTPPPAVGGFAVSRYLDGYLVSWEASSAVDIAGYELRVGGANWDASTLITQTPQTKYFDARNLGNTFESSLTLYRIKAFDVLGIYSVESSLLAESSPPLLPIERVDGVGDLAGLDYVRLGMNIRDNAGVITLADADLITNLGTASAISGQGALATRGDVLLGTHVRNNAGTVLLADADVITAQGQAASALIAPWTGVSGRPLSLPDLDATASAALAGANTEIANARRGEASLLASVSAAAITATWSSITSRPLDLAGLDSTARTELTNTRDEVVAARGASATVAARIATEETARAAGDSALTGRASVIESTMGGDLLNANGNFAQGWTGNAIPPGWGDWAYGTTGSSRVTGLRSSNAFQLEVTQLDQGIQVIWATGDRGGPGWYVIEADVVLVSGSLVGAGLHINASNAGATTWLASANMIFASEPDINGTVHGAGTAGRAYRWRKLINLAHPDIRNGLIYAMGNWQGFGALTAKTIQFHRVGVRPATAAEVAGQQARDDLVNNAVVARIGAEETARAAADSALTSSISTLTTTVNGNEATNSAFRSAQTSTNASNAASISTLTTTVNGNEATNSAFRSAQTSTNASNAASISTLTAQVNVRANQFRQSKPRPGLTASAQGWVSSGAAPALSVALWYPLGGEIWYVSRAGGSIAESLYYVDVDSTANVWIAPGEQYTLSAVGYSGNATLRMRIDLFDADSNFLEASPWVTLTSYSQRFFVSTTYAGSPRYVRRRVLFKAEWPSSGSYIVFNLIKLESGSTATAFTSEGMDDVLQASITTVNSVAVDAQGKANAIVGFRTDVNGKISGMTSVNNGDVSATEFRQDVFKIVGSNNEPIAAFAAASGGGIQLNDVLIRGLNVTPAGGGPAHRVALRANTYAGTDGATITWSPAYAGIPAIRALLTSPPAVAAGETYEVVASSVASNGFTVRAKKFTPGTPVARDTGAGSNVGGTPPWRVHKPTTDDADGGAYTFRWQGTIAKVWQSYDAFLNRTLASYEGEFNVYYNSGSGWVSAFGELISETTTAVGNVTAPTTISIGARSVVALNLPAIGQHSGEEFGIEGVSGGAVTAFDGVTYTTTPQSSVTALPGTFVFEVQPPS